VEQIEPTLKRLLEKTFDGRVRAEDIGAGQDLVEEYGLDSLRAISFLLSIQDAFGIDMEPDAFERQELRSVRGLAEHIAAAAREAPAEGGG
jgi:acyl carrier protein